MPTKNFLSCETKESLQQALKEHEHPDIRQRALIFLLLNNGNTQAQTAELIGCYLRKVAYGSIHGEPENLDSFNDERMKGNYRKPTEEYINLLLETIEVEPEKYGYEFGRGTTARLARYLGEKTGIELTSTQVRRILQSQKYVYLWAKYSLEDKQDTVERGLFKDKLAEDLRIAKESPALLQVW
jgi:transposase